MSLIEPTVLVAYESLFGATRHVAEAIGEGIGGSLDVEVRPVREVPPGEVSRFDLLVLGAPTHARMMPSPASRAEGARWIDNSMRGHALEPKALEGGLREWLARVSLVGIPVASFTTRMDLMRILSGSAVRSIDRAVRRAGGTRHYPGFEARVDKRGNLVAGERDRAREWGRSLAWKTTDDRVSRAGDDGASFA